MKTVMRPRPAGHGLPWSGPVNGPLDTTDVSSPVTDTGEIDNDANISPEFLDLLDKAVGLP